MKFDLSYKIRVEDDVLDPNAVLGTMDSHRESLLPIGELEGAVVLDVDGDEFCGDYYDPIVRLANHWVRKVPWILGGDTETVAFRNSEHCFAFVPAGEGVEVSFFVGTEAEIEEYICDPVIVRMDMFVEQSITFAENVLAFVSAADPTAAESDEDVRDLRVSLDEARSAWRDHQLHNRR